MVISQAIGRFPKRHFDTMVLSMSLAVFSHLAHISMHSGLFETIVFVTIRFYIGVTLYKGISM